MFVEAYITVRVEVGESTPPQKAVADALLEHVTLLKAKEVGPWGTEGAVTWNVVFSE